MRVEKNGIVIRDMTENDMPHMFRWLTDERVLEFYEGRDVRFTMETLTEKFTEDIPDGFRCIIEYEDRPIGYCQAYRLSGEMYDEYSYSEDGRTVFATDQFIGEPENWNKGIGTSFLKLMTEYLTKEKGAEVILLDPHKDNHRAVRAYEKARFRIIGSLPEHELFEGKKVDCWLMEYRPSPDDKDSETIDDVMRSIYDLFFEKQPVSVRVIDTSRGDEDFRNTLIFTSADGEKQVLKIVSNDFSFPEKISIWQRTAEEYISLGYYCPRIISDRKGSFPSVRFRGRECVAYAEEFSKYSSLEDRTSCMEKGLDDVYNRYMRDIWSMTARIAAKKLDYTEYPSAYCLFETFCPSDRTDEVLENALKWKELADALPEMFSEQVDRIWKLWNDNRNDLEKIYGSLPTSVFQADLNSTNLLIDEDGAFVGICDFNLSGKDVFLNYLMRENDTDTIPEALKIASETYVFSEEEKAAALPLYRCLKPLWWSHIQELKDAGEDKEAVGRSLDASEKCLTEEIDLRQYMEPVSAGS